MMTIMLIALLTASTVVVTMAEPLDACKAIKNDQERLACFDAGGKTPKTDQAKSTSSATRDAFAAKVRRAFLAGGQDLLVMSNETRPGYTNSLYPAFPG
jgi:hypothetical protein